ncbi:MAG: hypothetical protein WC998_02620 [Candidatus Paceibacterota bacterium]|jgi:hypothetical protein
MASIKTLTIGQICAGGESLPRVLFVIRNEEGKNITHVFLVHKVIKKEGGIVIVKGVDVESNCPGQLDQNTKVYHFCH